MLWPVPGLVQGAYDTAEKNFGDSVCTLITGISVYVNQIIKIADEIITDARAQNLGRLPTELPAPTPHGAEQEKAFAPKLDALHDKAEQTRTTFNKELNDNAGNAVQAAREEIQKLRKAAADCGPLPSTRRTIPRRPDQVHHRRTARNWSASPRPRSGPLSRRSARFSRHHRRADQIANN